MPRVLVGLVVVSCAIESEFPSASTDIATSDIAMSVKATAGAGGSPVIVNLSVGPDAPLPLNLVETDRLVVRLPKGDLPMVRQANGVYGADLGLAEGDLHVMILRTVDRPLDFPIFVPPSFVIHAPTSASRAAPLNITWDVGAGPYSLELDVTDDGTPHCVVPAHRPLSFDSGSYTFNPYELAYSQPLDLGTCTASVTIQRTTFGPGNVVATQTRTVTFGSRP